MIELAGGGRSARWLSPFIAAPFLAVVSACTPAATQTGAGEECAPMSRHAMIVEVVVPAGDTIITDDQHIHYGKGEAVTRLNLEPGEHLLRLQFANGAHIALDGAEYQDEITITVRE